MASAEARRRRRRKVLPGYPVETPFKTEAEVQAYLGQAKITCLRCGQKKLKLGVHLLSIHEMTPEEYKAIYGIPWTFGLTCPDTHQRISDNTKDRIASGELKAGGAEQAALARAAAKNYRRPKQPATIQGMVARSQARGTGRTAAREAKQAKKGTPEFRAKMLARPQTISGGETMGAYWRGRKQSPEHIANRVASLMKRKNNGT